MDFGEDAWLWGFWAGIDLFHYKQRSQNNILSF